MSKSQQITKDSQPNIKTWLVFFWVGTLMSHKNTKFEQGGEKKQYWNLEGFPEEWAAFLKHTVLYIFISCLCNSPNFVSMHKNCGKTWQVVVMKKKFRRKALRHSATQMSSKNKYLGIWEINVNKIQASRLIIKPGFMETWRKVKMHTKCKWCTMLYTFRQVHTTYNTHTHTHTHTHVRSFVLT